jgi:hypothetical protein
MNVTLLTVVDTECVREAPASVLLDGRVKDVRKKFHQSLLWKIKTVSLIVLVEVTEFVGKEGADVISDGRESTALSESPTAEVTF